MAYLNPRSLQQYLVGLYGDRLDSVDFKLEFVQVESAAPHPIVALSFLLYCLPLLNMPVSGIFT